jgi:hypothetical protein
MDGANGQTGGKNRSSTFVLTAFISFGLFNIFPLVAGKSGTAHLGSSHLMLINAGDICRGPTRGI